MKCLPLLRLFTQSLDYFLHLKSTDFIDLVDKGWAKRESQEAC